jgi:hypothetical protein
MTSDALLSYILAITTFLLLSTDLILGLIAFLVFLFSITVRVRCRGPHRVIAFFEIMLRLSVVYYPARSQPLFTPSPPHVHLYSPLISSPTSTSPQLHLLLTSTPPPSHRYPTAIPPLSHRYSTAIPIPSNW